jgi:hypothetical protein
MPSHEPIKDNPISMLKPSWSSTYLNLNIKLEVQLNIYGPSQYIGHKASIMCAI